MAILGACANQTCCNIRRYRFVHGAEIAIAIVRLSQIGMDDAD
jgi:hypothetical protein